jgi:hypothetical protein
MITNEFSKLEGVVDQNLVQFKQEVHILNFQENLNEGKSIPSKS